MNFRRRALRYIIMSWLIMAAVFTMGAVFGIPGYIVYTAYVERTRTEIPVNECNLPCRCKHLLGLGTWEWADCLGVGKK
ncbi:hypothetical protein LCGC14_2261430 [marine sediment metagenome]|uniref:Uncharacterized protein n=1 Tax=marine sediment metagenome TaxID=412755 RepID=A0A0F9DLZ2_9ZZZZ